MTVGPSHDNLQDIVQAIEFDAARHLHTPPDGRVTAAQGDFEFVDRKSLCKPLFSRCDHRIIKTFRQPNSQRRIVLGLESFARERQEDVLHTLELSRGRFR